MAPITCSLGPSQGHVFGHLLAVPGQSQATHKVYEGSGEVQLETKLASAIVEGKRVMVVVKALP